jgi:hypothetical protein
VSVACGLVITAELDSNPAAGRKRLEAVLGPATVAMESGGLWLDPELCELIPKLHLHWRLAQPTRTPIEHDFLKEANRLATQLGGGDPSAVPLVHPLRWAGTVHRKAEPRLARIIDCNPVVEILLAESLAKLRGATQGGARRPHGSSIGNDQTAGRPKTSHGTLLDVVATITVIPNDDRGAPRGSSWKPWNDMGLRIYAATGGSEAGLVLFIDWSQRSKKFNDTKTRERWHHFATSPPDRTNVGALFNLARKHSIRFERPSQLALRAERGVAEAQFDRRFVGDPGPS